MIVGQARPRYGSEGLVSTCGYVLARLRTRWQMSANAAGHRLLWRRHWARRFAMRWRPDTIGPRWDTHSASTPARRPARQTNRSADTRGGLDREGRGPSRAGPASFAAAIPARSSPASAMRTTAVRLSAGMSDTWARSSTAGTTPLLGDVQHHAAPRLRVVGRFSAGSWQAGRARSMVRSGSARAGRLRLWMLSGSSGSILTGMTGRTSAAVIPL